MYNVGTGGCRAYDTVPTPLQPFCGNSTGGVLDDAPAWCFDQFCYVDPNNCSFHTTLAGVFPDSGGFPYFALCSNCF
jgi:hypothetical protein